MCVGVCRCEESGEWRVGVGVVISLRVGCGVYKGTSSDRCVGVGVCMCV